MVVRKLQAMGTPPYLLRFVNNWLTDRRIQVEHRGAFSKPLRTNNGIPQGSCLSVLLWLVFINDIPILPQDGAIYVDDSLTWVVANSYNSMVDQLHDRASAIAGWCHSNHVQVNVDKTHILANSYNPHLRVSFEPPRS